MDKSFADEMIADYQKKFFGFALGKCSSLNEAEELAARITCEAYMTLRTVEEVYNWEGYLYRIAHNVYAHYVKEQTKHRQELLEGEEPTEQKDYAAEYARNEELALLQREVAWLGRRHREIVLLHYYHNKKISEIARILELPEGTVKWHLSEAKTQLKEGMKQVRRKGNLGIEPVKMIEMGNIGTPGELGDTEQFLNSKLRQNIAFAAYYESRTIEEMAEELGVSPVFIEDEVEYLTEYGFLDLLPGQRYRTNMFIDNVPGDILEQSMELSREIAKVFCDFFIPEIMETYRDWNADIYVPDNDRNYWYWTKIARVVTDVGIALFNLELMKKKNYYVKRRDGGEYVAFASIERAETANRWKKENKLCGPMWVVDGKKKIGTWSLSTSYDNRAFGWEENRLEDIEAFGMFLRGQLPKTEALLDKYVRLYDRGFIVNRDGKDVVNVIVEKETVFDESFVEKIYRDVTLPEKVKRKMDRLIQQKIQLEKPYYPGHMHEMLKLWHEMRPVNIVMVLEELENRGILRPLTEEQKKGVMVIAYSDIIPE
ncbi:MAG: RNA polymerase sigma factor [Lachnospiraceae bacterium]|nr:RNA polymerase sigma factor [Lachnospiraceae bacterium]